MSYQVVSTAETVATIASEVAVRVRLGDSVDNACTAVGRRYGLSRVAVARLAVPSVRVPRRATTAEDGRAAA